MPAHGNLFAGDFGVKIDELHFNRGIEFGEHAVRGAKRAVDGRHESAALQVEYGAFYAIPRADCNGSFARPLRVICRPQQTRLPPQIIEDFPLIPNMIAAGEHVDAERQEIFRDGGRDAKSASGIFRIGDNQID